MQDGKILAKCNFIFYCSCFNCWSFPNKVFLKIKSLKKKKKKKRRQRGRWLTTEATCSRHRGWAPACRSPWTTLVWRGPPPRRCGGPRRRAAGPRRKTPGTPQPPPAKGASKGGVLFENKPALYFCNYILITAYKTYIFRFRIKDTAQIFYV